jgi:hypothetical protein
LLLPSCEGYSNQGGRGWARLLPLTGGINLYKKIWSEDLKGKDLLENVGVDGRIILKLILKNCGVWTCLECCPVAGFMNMIVNLWVS